MEGGYFVYNGSAKGTVNTYLRIVLCVCPPPGTPEHPNRDFDPRNPNTHWNLTYSRSRGVSV